MPAPRPVSITHNSGVRCCRCVLQSAEVSPCCRPQNMEESESDPHQDSDALHCYGFCKEINLRYVFDNIWFFYLIFLGILICLPSLAYAVFIKCCNPARLPAVKWHIIIFIINCSVWFVLPATILAGLCRLPISHGFYVIALPFLFVLVILTILDLFLSPEGKYFLNCQRVYDTSAYLEMVRAALPSIRVNVKSLYREPTEKNLKLNRPGRKMIVTAHRYFPIDSYSDETSLPCLDQEGNNQVSTFHVQKIVEPGDDFSHKQFTTFKTKFIGSCQRNRGGQFLEDTVEMDIPGLEDRVVTLSSNGASLPWWARRKVFYILSTLSASILLREGQFYSNHLNVSICK